MIIDTISNVAQGLFGVRSQLAGARRDRKDRVADYLSGLAQTIEETSASLSQGIYPHGKCQELLSHSQTMVAAIGDVIGQQPSADYAAQLKEVWEIERLHAELSGLPIKERERRLHVLDQAAGLFRAAAAYVRVSP